MVNKLQSYGVDYDILPVSVQTGLQLLSYNTGGASVAFGPSLGTALASGDYAGAAAQLALNTAQQGQTAYENRGLTSAAVLLGFQVTLDTNNMVSSLIATANVDDQQVINFVKDLAALYGVPDGHAIKQEYNLEDFTNTPAGGSFLEQLITYTVSKGYYVVLPTDTLSSIASLLNTDPETLALINGGGSISSLNLTPGSVIAVPAAIIVLVDAPADFTQANPGFNYYYAANSDTIYQVSNLPSSSSATSATPTLGNLIIGAGGPSINVSLIKNVASINGSLVISLSGQNSGTTVAFSQADNSTTVNLQTGGLITLSKQDFKTASINSSGNLQLGLNDPTLTGGSITINPSGALYLQYGSTTSFLYGGSYSNIAYSNGIFSGTLTTASGSTVATLQVNTQTGSQNL